MLSRFSIIVSIDIAGGISKGGAIPWPTSTFFRDLTTGGGRNAVIMGRCTYDSIPPSSRPLEGRHVFVISRTWRQEDHQEVTVCESVMDALTLTGNKVNSYDNIFIAGGETLFNSITKSYMYLCDKIYVTRYKMNYQCDKFFDVDVFANLPLFQPTQLTHDFQRYYYQNTEVHPEYDYLRLLQNTLENGESKTYRGETTKEIFGATIKFNVGGRHPIITTRQIDFSEVLRELLMWLSGNTIHSGCENTGSVAVASSSGSGDDDSEYSVPEINRGSSMPSERVEVFAWCDLPHIAKRELIERFERGDYGPYEGFLLRHWNADYDDGNSDYSGKGLDQLEYLITNLRTSPSSHKHIANMWNLGYYADQLQHPECLSIQFSQSGDGRYLDLLVSKRESNIFSQLPNDILKFSALLVMMSHVVKLRARNVIFNIGHAYVRHSDETIILRQCKRTPRPFPTLSFRRAARIKELSDFTLESFDVELYTSWPPLKSKD
jgi:thymidylate synthase